MPLDAREYHNPDPAYLRGLLRQSDLSQAEAAARIGIPLRTLERNLQQGTKYPADYRTQYMLERLAEMTPAERDDARAEDEAFAEVERQQKSRQGVGT